MKRMTMIALEQLAFAEHIAIEVDNEQGIALTEFAGCTYYARLDDTATAS
jgi:hypothetical protein